VKVIGHYCEGVEAVKSTVAAGKKLCEEDLGGFGLCEDGTSLPGVGGYEIYACLADPADYSIHSTMISTEVTGDSPINGRVFSAGPGGSGAGIAGALGSGSGGSIGPGVAGGTGGGAFRPGQAAVNGTADANDFLAAARSINAAQGSQLGDLFEYKVKDRVTIRKNESAMVPIVQTEITAEKVSLWNAGLGTPRPLRALWFTNTSPLVLDGGSFNVIEGAAFGGEGLIESIQPSEKRRG
jgi:hypothetical protein